MLLFRISVFTITLKLRVGIVFSTLQIGKLKAGPPCPRTYSKPESKLNGFLWAYAPSIAKWRLSGEEDALGSEQRTLQSGPLHLSFKTWGRGFKIKSFFCNSYCLLCS